MLPGDRNTVAAIRTADGEVLADEVTVARGVLARALGLMFRRSFPDGRALLLDPGGARRIRLHMLFVPFPVDVVFLDEDLAVVATDRMAPWTGRASAKARYALELPAGATEILTAGDELAFVAG